MRPVVLGVLIGALVAAAAGGWVSGLLFETSGRDPVVIGAVAVVLLGVGVVASLLPGLRAAKADPVAALRAD
jgi:ABC-type antimicrobial peptide transport system permease subunit